MFSLVRLTQLGGKNTKQSFRKKRACLSGTRHAHGQNCTQSCREQVQNTHVRSRVWRSQVRVHQQHGEEPGLQTPSPMLKACSLRNRLKSQHWPHGNLLTRYFYCMFKKKCQCSRWIVIYFYKTQLNPMQLDIPEQF